MCPWQGLCHQRVGQQGVKSGTGTQKDAAPPTKDKCVKECAQSRGLIISYYIKNTNNLITMLFWDELWKDVQNFVGVQ